MRRESISALYADKCGVQKGEWGTANVQNNTVAPTSEDYDTQNGSSLVFFILASWDIMRVKDHAYSYRLLVRNNWGGTLRVLFLLHHTVHKVFFFFLFPLVSSCLFTKTDTVPQSDGCQFDASPLNQRLVGERASLPPVLRQPMAVRCPPGSLARWLQLTQHGQAAVQGKSGLSPWKPESTVM